MQMYVVIVRDFPSKNALFGLVSSNDSCWMIPVIHVLLVPQLYKKLQQEGWACDANKYSTDFRVSLKNLMERQP